jgi:selenocysteine lyase/cysteine desulfurase
MLPLRLVCDEVGVPCVDGHVRRFVDLDYAASTPALQAVADAVAEFLPWYASVHRGRGHRSRVATAAFEEARARVAAFVDARADDVVVFLANTTDATNTLSHALRPGSRVLGSPAEHHANLLPWRDHRLELLPFTASSAELVSACEAALADAAGEIRLVALSAASNVTGEVSPIAELASAAHRHGAELFVDAAQFVPHRRLSLVDTGVDYAAFSGHKLYAPFGAGVLIGRREGLREGEPLRKGGGAALRVDLERADWAEPPARYEAGSPNVVGAVALGAACEAIAANRPTLEQQELAVASALHAGLGRQRGLTVLQQWPEGSCDRLGVASFLLHGMDDDLLATVLADEWGIGVRQGRFCAHPLVDQLTAGIEQPRVRGRRVGAVRASTGIGTRPDDVAALLEALASIAAEGPRWRYELDELADEWRPTPDPRPATRLPHPAEAA